MKRFAFVFFTLLSLVSAVYAQRNTALTFQVLQAEINLDNAAVKSAAIKNSGHQFQGLIIELKPAAAQALRYVTKNGINQPVQILFNNQIVLRSKIKTELTNKILLTGISKKDAVLYLQQLKQNEFIKIKREHPDTFFQQLNKAPLLIR